MVCRAFLYRAIVYLLQGGRKTARDRKNYFTKAILANGQKVMADHHLAISDTYPCFSPLAVMVTTDMAATALDVDKTDICGLALPVPF